MAPVSQAQTFGDIRIEGQGNSLIINQVVQIAVAEIKTRKFVASSPYVGLRRFEAGNKDFFFGRDQLIGQLLQEVARRNLVLVAGASGSGKSSVVRAGLVPQLSERLPQGRFRALVLTPDVDPFSSLRAALQTAGVSQSKLKALEAGTADALVQILTEQRPAEELWLLFVDQFEEIFTRCSEIPRREAFLSGLTRLAELPQSELRIVLAMRADFFDRFGPHPAFGKQAAAGICLVMDLEASQLRAAIEQPAARHGVVFEEGLVEQIIADVKGRPGALPLLQYTLDLLWHADDPASDRTLHAQSYHRLGGIEGALRLRADALFGYLDKAKTRVRPASEKETMRRIFLRVVDVTGQGAEARAVAKRAHPSEFKTDEEQRLIAELVDEKLLVSNAAVGQAATAAASTVELAHEALLSAWPLLKGWIEQAREVLYVRNRLSADESRWIAEKRKNPDAADDELWSGTRLLQAQDLRIRGDFRTVLGGLSAEEEAFLDAALLLRDRRAHEEQERRDQLARKELEKQQQRTRYQRIVISLLSVFLMIAGGIAYYALNQKRAAEQRELDLVVEQGRQLLVERDKPLEAVLFLHRAYTSGSRSSAIPYLLAETMRPIDATRLILKGHTGYVTSASFSPDGGQVVTSSDDKTAQIWDAHSGQPIRALKGHTDAVSSASFSSDGRQIVTASRDQTARIWDAQDGRSLRSFTGHMGYVTSASFSPDRRRIVTASHDQTARVWDTESGQPQLFLRGHTDGVRSASFSSDGRHIVTTSDDKTARIWDAENGQLLRVLEGHAEAIHSANFSPDGRRVLTASDDKTARIWDAENGQLLHVLHGHTEAVHSASFSSDGRYIVTASGDQTVRVWDTQDQRMLSALAGHSGGVTSASFSRDGLLVISASRDQTARIWAPQTGHQALSLKGHTDGVTSASFSRDGRRIVTASRDQTARVWDAETGQQALSLKGHIEGLTGAGFSPDGRRIVTTSRDQTVRIWDAQDGRQLQVLKGHTDPVSSAGFSPDGRYLVTASADQTARIWDTQTGQQLRSLEGHTGYVDSAGFSPDGRLIITTSWPQTVQIWDAKTGQQLRSLQEHTDGVRSASFSPDGRLLVTAHDDKIARIWNADNGQLVLSLQGHRGGVTSASFSPDPEGRRIVTASEDKTVGIWDAQNGRQLISLKGHAGRVNGASFSPDGSRIVTASEDNTAMLFYASAETRGAEQLARILRCRLELRLKGAIVVPAELDPTACHNLVTSP
jgi:WD40 repeat protein